MVQRREPLSFYHRPASAKYLFERGGGYIAKGLVRPTMITNTVALGGRGATLGVDTPNVSNTSISQITWERIHRDIISKFPGEFQLKHVSSCFRRWQTALN